MLNDYYRGILYGDGYLQGEDLYIFSTTHKELAEKISGVLSTLNVNFSNYLRDNKSFENWELLELVEIKDEIFIDYLISIGFTSEDVEKRMIFNSEFLRGYLETKGTFFKYNQRNSTIWKCAFSGKYEEMDFLKRNLESLGIETQEIARRTEREEVGIISNSYRLSISKRESIAILVDFLYNENSEVSEYLKEKFIAFIKFHKYTPLNQKKKIYKHYKYASMYMAKHLGYEVKGNRKNKGGSREKPIYLYDIDNVVVDEYLGWKGAYLGLVKLYEKETCFEAPKVESEELKV